MTRAPRAPTFNRLLNALPADDRRRIVAGCEAIELAPADILCGAGERVRHVYFPVRSVISLVMAIDGASHLEVGLIGSEGMVGLPLALGMTMSRVDVIVQDGGSALRMDAASFGRELAQNRPLQSVMDRYVRVRYRSQAAPERWARRSEAIYTTLAGEDENGIVYKPKRMRCARPRESSPGKQVPMR